MTETPSTSTQAPPTQVPSTQAPSTQAPSTEVTAAAGDQTWRTKAERGSILGIRLMIWMTTFFGRAPARLIVRVIAFYYALFATDARRATRGYLARLGETDRGFGRVYRQILRFAQVGLDALFLVSGKTHYFQFERTGTDHLRKLVAEGKGAVLLSGHLGSMYAMRATGKSSSFPVHPLVYSKHAERINAVFKQLDPDNQASFIEMGEGVDFILRVREAIDAGGIVAIMGDRVGADERTVEVEFLGEMARFPTGPYILASILKCPVYLVFGLYRDPSGYELHCELFAERVVLPRAGRQEALRALVERYAARLEHYCRLAPDNWFNFYEFWGKDQPPHARGGDAAVAPSEELEHRA